MKQGLLPLLLSKGIVGNFNTINHKYLHYTCITRRNIDSFGTLSHISVIIKKDCCIINVRRALRYIGMRSNLILGLTPFNVGTVVSSVAVKWNCSLRKCG